MDNIKNFLRQHNIINITDIIYNPTYEQLFKEETKQGLEGYEKAYITNLGAVAVDTGMFTGRSPKDKYIVEDGVTKETIWWATKGKNDNKPITKEIWDELKTLVSNHLSGKRLFIIDAICGANHDTSLKVRFITEVAWQAHFVKNMFIPLTTEDERRPIDFTVINAAEVKNDKWQQQGLNSDVFIAFNFSEKVQLIGGTWYGGEMKKGMFSVMNYLLPLKGIASMHCSANVYVNGDVNLFFGLSGTGKTTLSTDPKCKLIGDDEHGWDDQGIFNFEGGCYAKVIDLDEEHEPDIYRAIKRDALLENVVIKENGEIDFSDSSKTENTRVSYPLNHIKNVLLPSRATHAKNILCLTADAFGILPPVAFLTPQQAEYYFLLGFTSKMAGTEIDVREPQPVFSSCFGAAFLTLHPTQYSSILMKKIKQHDVNVYLVNTGWNGLGKRISLKDTRAIVNSILNGSIKSSETAILPIFNLTIPTYLEGVADILDPRKTYEDSDIWQEKAKNLAKLFIDNFAKFTDTEEGKLLAKCVSPTV